MNPLLHLSITTTIEQAEKTFGQQGGFIYYQRGAKSRIITCMLCPTAQANREIWAPT